MENIKITLSKDGKISRHKNWATLANCYGWRHDTAYKAFKKHGEYKGFSFKPFIPFETEVSIPCQLLREFLQQGHTQKNNFNNDLETQEVVFTIGVERQYVITASVTNTITVSEVATDANGHDLTQRDYSAEVTEIKEVINEHGEELKLDKATEQLLLEKLEL